MAKDYYNLRGKVALITGASSGLGIHFSKVLASEGCTVILAARREDKLKEEVAAICETGAQAIAVAMDVTNVTSVKNAFAQIQTQVGAVDILINNAGVATDPLSFLETDEEDWNWIIDTNLNGAWRVARQAAMQMIAADKGGSIVNISSVYGLKTGVMKIAYNASKAAVAQLTKSMSMELCRKNIRVNALCPGWFQTDINSNYFSTEAGQRYIARTPSGRMGQQEELTVPLLLLASDAGSYMNGTTLVVDGGISESPI